MGFLRQTDEVGLDSSKAIVVLAGPEGLGRWQRREADAALDRQTRHPEVPVIPVLLPRARPLPSFLALNTWVDLQKGIDDAPSIDLLAAGILGKISTVDQLYQAEAIRERVCPYLGLSAFGEDDAEFFFGREVVVTQLVAVLRKSPFVALVGA
ncbi:MAG TPA: TIR domain-containing protein, partial [Gemmatimonadales bacterium]|nr:TIR domain-containing protein [Gemmatimonadales bacterium]